MRPETPMKASINTVCDLVEKWGADIVVKSNNGGDAWDLLLKQALKARGLTAQVSLNSEPNQARACDACSQRRLKAKR